MVCSTLIFCLWSEPRRCSCFIYRCSISLGYINMLASEFAPYVCHVSLIAGSRAEVLKPDKNQ
ncbi:hypothetical protein HanPSC8_Chr05g0200901 [Helianthus annuus]|nr:hypothetical protein HanPSC8_Chr05g0200901 [Helianthus annuus]